MIGVLGGMGPAATQDFFAKVIAATPAADDDEHVPLLIQSDPRIPRRPAAILSGGPSPLPALLAGRDRLIAAGATALAMPCNTAHYWYGDLAADCPVPFLSIVDACCDELTALVQGATPVGLIGTRATLQARLFDAALTARGHALIQPGERQMQSWVLPGIARVKAARPAEGAALLEPAVRALLDEGAGAVILGCTEVPIALEAVHSELLERCIDSTAALARLCVAWWQAGHVGGQG